MEKIKVMVVDDQAISRKFFENLVKSSGRYELVCAIDDAGMADIYCAKYPVDLVIMDVMMRESSDGLTAAARLKKSYPSVKIIVVTSMPEVSFIERAKAADADSFWYKEADSTDMLSVMDRTMNGERVYPLRTPPKQLGLISSDELTESELSVLRELTTGAGNVQIGEKLCLSANTVRVHISHMLEKTGFENRTELAIEARIKGIVIGEKK